MKSSRPTIESLRQAWGRDVARERDMATIALYEEFVAGRSQSVDEQTWQDLGMDQVFAAGTLAATGSGGWSAASTAMPAES